MFLFRSFTSTRFLLHLFLVFSFVGSASAAVITVTNTADSGAGSLRQALLEAGTNFQDDTIVFDPAVFNTPQTILLTSGQLVTLEENTDGNTLARSLKIQGPGADLLTISGGGQSRVLQTSTRSRVTVSGITFTGGNGRGAEWDRSGGAIVAQGGNNGYDEPNFMMIKCVVRNNTTGPDGAIGGGIFISARASIIDSAIIYNSVPFSGGGMSLFSGGTVSIINSTVSNNEAGGNGAGIYSRANLNVTNSTIAFNRTTRAGSTGAGVYVDTGAISIARMNPINSIFAKNSSDQIYGRDVFGVTITRGNNIFGEADISNPNNDFVFNDPQLNPALTTTNGPIPYHALNTNSLAIDNGSNCVLTSTAAGGCGDPVVMTDARGVERPQDGNGDGVATVDIGAFEARRAEITIAPTAAPLLQQSSDSGVDNLDGITANSTLSFDLTGLTAGAAVELVRDGTTVATGTAQGTTLVLTDLNATINGEHFYSARQIVGGSASLLGPSVRVVTDNIAPVPTVSQAPTQLDPTRNPVVSYVVTFDEFVSGFGPADITLAGSTANLSGAGVAVINNGTVYNVQISSISGDGTVVVGVLPGSLTDLAGNVSAPMVANDNSVLYDTTPARVTINQAAGQSDPTRFMPINFTVVFDEPVTGFTGQDVTLSGTALNINFANKTVTGSGTTYNVAVSGLFGGGATVVASIPANVVSDLAGNSSSASTSTDNVVILDNESPSVTIDQAVGQSDPTNAEPVNFTVVFSEPVTGFDAADVNFSGSSPIAAFATSVVTGSGTTYNVAVSNIAPSNGGTLRVNVGANAATDAIGNPSLSSVSGDNNVRVDNFAPRVSVNQDASQPDPTSVQPVFFRITFTESVTGLTSSDISLAGSTADVSNAQIVVTSISGSSYLAAISGIGATGTVTASVAAAAARDAVGNESLAATSIDNTVTLRFATITGRVLTPTGQAVRNAVVTMTDAQGNRRTATTSSFGIYTFEAARVNENLSLSVASKRYRFAARVLIITENAVDVNFTGLE